MWLLLAVHICVNTAVCEVHQMPTHLLPAGRWTTPLLQMPTRTSPRCEFLPGLHACTVAHCHFAAHIIVAPLLAKHDMSKLQIAVAGMAVWILMRRTRPACR